MAFLGLDPKYSASQITLIGVPWEVTTSYGAGASLGPEAIMKASPQLDLFDFEFGDASGCGIYYKPLNPELLDFNHQNKQLAQEVIQQWDTAGKLTPEFESRQNEVNLACEQVMEQVEAQVKTVLQDHKVPAVIGGDHSVPLGLIKALCEQYNGELGILHFDAHADLRKSYQGFTHSHASVMRNVMELATPPENLVQVGVRDFCKEEWDYIHRKDSSVIPFFDRSIKKQLLQGKSWQEIANSIVESLPQNVYISFDIDGLSPDLCPNTGTPVAGGLNFDQVVFIFETLVRSGRKIIGFDLVEVAPGHNEWDGNVGARILYQLCGYTLASQGHLGLRDNNE